MTYNKASNQKRKTGKEKKKKIYNLMVNTLINILESRNHFWKKSG